MKSSLCSALAAVAVMLPLVFGCSASSKYQAVRTDEYVGEWTFYLDHEAWRHDFTDDPIVTSVEVFLVGVDPEEYGELLERMTDQDGEFRLDGVSFWPPNTYWLEFTDPLYNSVSGGGADTPLVFCFQSFDTPTYRLASFNRLGRDYGFFYDLSVPIRHTLRVRESDTGFELLAPETPLIWSESFYVGMTTDPRERAFNTYKLIKDYNDIIRHYASIPEERWHVVARIERPERDGD